ncbi:hypothetical protein HB779_23595 (plasmid) [Phyllobacterium sp. 628]|uniref:hypothetical protein n=1 Tax=Phyllobacterium sp. 628 TaxID=2718938 RepID=UPI0016622C6F|nr:hypothetical protein [Phyllobacterium sp. 628]QND54874.1 hypothetical protein HB779_23595 [Phyllobacterium sp. 628]
MEEDPIEFAHHLRQRAITYGVFTCILMVATSLIADKGGALFAGLWPLMMVGGLITLFLTGYLFFDAALFRYIASHEDALDGCKAVDDILARMHLRARPDKTRPLHVRISGTKSTLLKLHIAFAVFITLFVALVVYGVWSR